MEVTHVTHRRNLDSILRRGLLAGKSRQRRKAVWFVPPSRVGWAVRHVCGKRGSSPLDVCIIRVRLPRAALRRHRYGLYWTGGDVGPERIVSVTGVGYVALYRRSANGLVG